MNNKNKLKAQQQHKKEIKQNTENKDNKKKIIKNIKE